MKLEFIVEQDGNLLKLIQDKYPKLNYNQLKTALRKKDIKVDGIRSLTNCNVLKNSSIEIYLPNQAPKKVNIVFEDQNVVICHKPCGMETTKQDKMFDSECLEDVLPYKAMHRLDKNTEGLVIMAKNDMSYAELHNAFKTHLVTKKYLAIVSGKVKENENLVAYLIKDSKHNIVKIFDKKVEHSEQIKTNYKLLSSLNGISLLEVELLTGKTHQIRAHLAHEGIYILGDEKYGNKQINKQYKAKKQCLCAYKLKFNFSPSNPLEYLNNKTIETSPSFSLEKFANKDKNV